MGFSTTSFAYFVEESCIHFLLLEIILDLLTFLKHVLRTSTLLQLLYLCISIQNANNTVVVHNIHTGK